VKGRKRHLLVDTQGLVLKVLVHAADVHDRDGGRLLLEAFQPNQAHFPRLAHLWVDAGYRGRFVTWVKDTLGWSVEVVKHWWTGVAKVWVFPGQEPPEKPTGFQLLKWRWIVERTFAWIGFSRRMSKDYEYLPETSEAMVYTVMSRLMLTRLAARTP
jgi:transposase